MKYLIDNKPFTREEILRCWEMVMAEFDVWWDADNDDFLDLGVVVHRTGEGDDRICYCVRSSVYLNGVDHFLGTYCDANDPSGWIGIDNAPDEATQAFLTGERQLREQFARKFGVSLQALGCPVKIVGD